MPLSFRKEKSSLEKRVLSLQKAIKIGTNKELEGCLESAVQLIENLADDGDIEGEERLQMAAKLVDLVEKSLDDPGGGAEWTVVTFSDEDGVEPFDKPPEEELRRINDMLMGEILVSLGIVTDANVEEALALQDNAGMPLGEALATIGAAKLDDIQIGVRVQSHLRRASEDAEKHARALEAEARRAAHEALLGEILIRIGVITREQLEEALRIQQMADLRIGTALAAIGAATWGEIWSGVRVQKQLRAVAHGDDEEPDSHEDGPDPDIWNRPGML